MLEAQPQLTPTQVRESLQRTATPLAAYYVHETGAGALNAHAAALDAAFPERRIGIWRAAIDRQAVRFVNEPLRRSSGTALSYEGYEITLPVPEDTVSLSTQIAWGPLWSTNDLSLSLRDAAGITRAEANVLNLPGLTGKRERAALFDPAAGAWRVRVAHTINQAAPVGLAQPFDFVAEITRAEYRGAEDIGVLAPAARDDVRRALRSYAMSSYGARFFPQFGVTRAELARSLVLGAGVPQYTAGVRRYSDARDFATAGVVESAQNFPLATGGALFTDAQNGDRFRPFEVATRLVAAVALVRVAGLRAEAEQRADEPLALTDIGGVSREMRGYINVALRYDLLAAEGTTFKPSAPLTRLQLAHALSQLIGRAR